MIFDLILCGILILAFIIGFKRGLLRTVWGISALVASIVLATILHPYATEMFNDSIIAENLRGHVYSRVADKMENVDSGQDEIYTLPEKFSQAPQLDIDLIPEEQIADVTESIVNSVINIAGGLFLFIIIRIALAIVYNILKMAFSFPVLKQTNKLAGAVAQTVIVLALIYTALAIAAVLGTDTFEDTVICKMMYENNLLLAILTSA